MHGTKHFVLISLLCLSLVACKDNIYDKLYKLDLGVAKLSEKGDFKLVMDNGDELYPTNKLPYEVRPGARYKAHYNVESVFMNDSSSFLANIVELYHVSVIPMSMELEPQLKEQSVSPVNVERVWLGGGFLNVSFNFAKSRDTDTEHLIRLVWNNESDRIIYLDFLHYDNGDAPEETANACVSFPLSSIPGLATANKLTLNVLEIENENIKPHSYSLSLKTSGNK